MAFLYYFSYTSAWPTCNNSMIVIPAQSDPFEFLQLVALRVPLHNERCM